MGSILGFLTTNLCYRLEGHPIAYLYSTVQMSFNMFYKYQRNLEVSCKINEYVKHEEHFPSNCSMCRVPLPLTCCCCYEEKMQSSKVFLMAGHVYWNSSSAIGSYLLQSFVSSVLHRTQYYCIPTGFSQDSVFVG